MVIALASLGALAGSSGGSGGAFCLGERATLAGDDDANLLFGDKRRDDVVVGKGGNDPIGTGGGDDLICAGRVTTR